MQQQDAGQEPLSALGREAKGRKSSCLFHAPLAVLQGLAVLSPVQERHLEEREGPPPPTPSPGGWRWPADAQGLSKELPRTPGIEVMRSPGVKAWQGTPEEPPKAFTKARASLKFLLAL